jgi:dTDP-glucose 4,6-dehydratase
MSKTVLVTGGAGFIGSTFVHHLSQNHPDYKIIVLDALTYAASIDNLPISAFDDSSDQVRFWYGNVMNAELVDTLVADADFVVHFAAETHVTRSIYDNLQFFQTDVIGTHTIANAVLKAGKRVERFIHISTSEVYGTADGVTMGEEHPLNPLSPYASAKCGADRLVYSYWTTYGIPVSIIRPFNNYGPRQHLEKLIPRFISSCLLGEELTVHGSGEAARDFVHVDDCCRAIDMVLHGPEQKVIGEIFNVATNKHRSVSEIAIEITKAMDYPTNKIVNIGDRPGQVFRHTGDYSKLNGTLGWQPEISWQDGIRSTIDWFTTNREWWDKQLWMRKIPIRLASGKIEMH